MEEWPSCLWHPTHRLLLTVYVDDFKMSGPASTMREGWRLIREGIRTEDPTPAGKYLGCDHVQYAMTLPLPTAALREITRWPPGTPTPESPEQAQYLAGVQARYALGTAENEEPIERTAAITWDMSDFLLQCVELYQELGGERAQTLRRVDTPFVDVVHDPETSGTLQPIASRVLINILWIRACLMLSYPPCIYSLPL